MSFHQFVGETFEETLSPDELADIDRLIRQRRLRAQPDAFTWYEPAQTETGVYTDDLQDLPRKEYVRIYSQRWRAWKKQQSNVS